MMAVPNPEYAKARYSYTTIDANGKRNEIPGSVRWNSFKDGKPHDFVSQYILVDDGKKEETKP